MAPDVEIWLRVKPSCLVIGTIRPTRISPVAPDAVSSFFGLMRFDWNTTSAPNMFLSLLTDGDVIILLLSPSF